MKFIIIKIIILMSLTFLVNGCRQIFGDREQPDTITEITDVNSINIIQPVYASEFFKGEKMNIEWISSGYISKVDILLFKKDNFITVLANNTRNENSFTWNIPNNLNSSVHYLIHVINHNNSDEFDISERFIISD